MERIRAKPSSEDPGGVHIVQLELRWTQWWSFFGAQAFIIWHGNPQVCGRVWSWRVPSGPQSLEPSGAERKAMKLAELRAQSKRKTFNGN